jgi:hypothetical protein
MESELRIGRALRVIHFLFIGAAWRKIDFIIFLREETSFRCAR